MTNMQLLIAVINNTEKLDALMEALELHEIHGGTVFDSTGMASSLSKSPNMQVMSLIRTMLNGEEPHASKTILLVLAEDKLETAKQVIREVLGDMRGPNTGIMICVPITSAEGICK